MKSLNLLSLLPTRPQEFYDRLATYAAHRWDARHSRSGIYEPVDQDEAIRLLSRAAGGDLWRTLEEGPLLEFEARICKRRALLPRNSPFGSFHDGDTILARWCYAAVRILRPNTVVETGVGYGVTSAFILQALHMNDHGSLYSIDLPPLGRETDKYVGWLIPAQLRGRWKLHRGTSRRLLKPLLERCNKIDMFVHDSLHTYRNMHMEFGLVWPRMQSGAILISDDIESNSAFLELSNRLHVVESVVLRQLNKNALFGIAVKR